MKNRLRFFLFVVLAIFLVIALDKATVNSLDEEHHQASAPSDKPEKIKKISKKIMPPSHKQTWIIPIYPAGDLPISEPKVSKQKLDTPPKPNNQDASQKIHTPKKIDQTIPRRISTKRNGSFPVLEVSYEAIGFSGYLDAVERVGHFFLINNTEHGTQIGSEISLRSRTIYRHKIDLANLAVKRPHLVSDAMISKQLAGFSLPNDVQTDSIILVFSKPFDELLWDTIESALSKNDLSLHEISRIEGGYVRERGDVFLLVYSAERKDTGEDVFLNQRLRITLG
jgi:hypothetical protein